MPRPFPATKQRHLEAAFTFNVADGGIERPNLDLAIPDL
jgi:hypothetical protein